MRAPTASTPSYLGWEIEPGDELGVGTIPSCCGEDMEREADDGSVCACSVCARSVCVRSVCVTCGASLIVDAFGIVVDVSD